MLDELNNRSERAAEWLLWDKNLFFTCANFLLKKKAKGYFRYFII